MIGKIFGALAGAKLAKQSRGGVQGPGGALLGAGAVALARRFGPLGLVAAGVGGYLLKRHNERSAKRPASRT